MPKKEEALVTRDNVALTAVPDYLKKYQGDARGAEDLTKDDLKMPRLAIAQKTSPQIDESEPKYIPGLKFGQLFNDLTGEIYGEGPIYFTVVRRDKPRWIEFNPIDEGGGVKDFDVAYGDPRTAWTTDDNGKRQKPVATQFYDYVLLMEDTSEMIALSLKSTGLKVAKELNSMIKFRGTPSFTGRYELTTAIEKNEYGSFGVYRIRNAGFVTEEMAALGEHMYEAIKDRVLNIERDQSDDVVNTEVVDDKDVPF